MWDIEPVSGQSGTVMTEPVVEYGDHETEVKVRHDFVVLVPSFPARVRSPPPPGCCFCCRWQCVDVSLCGTLAVSGADDGVVNVFDGRV